MADALKAVRDDVRWLEDEFAHNTKDPIWLRECGARGWLVVCRAKRIRYRHLEIQAILEHSVGCFVLVQRKAPTKWEYLKLLTKTLDEMERLFGQTERPFIFAVNRDGIIARFR